MRPRLIVPIVAVALVVGAVVLVLTGDGSRPRATGGATPRQEEASLPARTVDAGGVQVRIEPLRIDQTGAAFLVILDTHSGDLRVDLAETARLEVGGADWGDAAWDGDPPGGHHRQGTLNFEPGGPTRGTARLAIDGLPGPVLASWTVEEG